MNQKGIKLVTVVALSSLFVTSSLGFINLTERTAPVEAQAARITTRLLYVKQGTDKGSSESDEESQGKQTKSCYSRFGI